MDDIFSKIAELLSVIVGPKDQPRDGTKLLESLRQLDELAKRHRGELPRDLIHYLERRSYEKALAFCRNAEEKK